MEAAGWIKRMEGKIAEDKNLLTELQAAHRSYTEERLKLLTTEDRRTLQKHGQLRSLTKTGIGGIAVDRWLKCLHLHVAHAMARENPIGELILNKIGRPSCPPDDVICHTYMNVATD